MKIIYPLLLVLIFSSCYKEPKKDVYKVTCPDPESLVWFNTKKAEYSSCTCLVGARQGIYQNQPVIEIYIYDPLCNGINVVYKADGTIWFNSSEAIYEDYFSKVRSQKVIWTCADGDL